MADDEGPIPAECCYKSCGVGADLLDAIGIDALGLLARAVAPLVGGHHTEARSRQRHNRARHAAPELRESVQGDDEGAFLRTGKGAVQANAIGQDVAVLDIDTIDRLDEAHEARLDPVGPRTRPWHPVLHDRVRLHHRSA